MHFQKGLDASFSTKYRNYAIRVEAISVVCPSSKKICERLGKASRPEPKIRLFVEEGGSDHDLGDLIRIDVGGRASVLEVALSGVAD